MMSFKEVSDFPPPGYRSEDQWMANFRRWHPPIMLVFVLLIQNGFLPGWFSITASVFLIGFSIFSLFIIWYLAFLLLAIKPFSDAIRGISWRDVFDLVAPVVLTYVLWNGQWFWSFVFYGFSLCNAIGLVLFYEVMRRREKC